MTRLAMLLCSILVVVILLSVGFVAGQRQLMERTVVVEYDYDVDGLWGPYFGRCFTVGHKGYCATEGNQK